MVTAIETVMKSAMAALMKSAMKSAMAALMKNVMESPMVNAPVNTKMLISLSNIKTTRGSFYWGALLVLLVNIVGITPVTAHNHQLPKANESHTSANPCKTVEIRCAKTVTSAFAPNGDLWRLWAEKNALYFQISKNNGISFTTATKVAITEETISARNENRPKIAFDQYSGIYLSWATPRERKYTADVRFSYSADYGKTFSSPVTVNNDNLLAGHSFNEMLVSDNGDVSIVWLDGRVAHQRRKQGKSTNGSALFMAQANPRKNSAQFTNSLLANGTCVCCRIAMDYNQEGELAVLWRHIYGDNIREFALLTVNKTSLNQTGEAEIIQISHDHWQINGCPHQGGGISIDESNRYHLVWFNLGDQGKGIFYARSNNQGKTLSKPLSIGNINAQAAHPNIMQNNNVVDIVWTQFTGIEHQLWHQQSVDNGKSFGAAKQIAQASSGSDRPFIIKKSDVLSNANSNVSSSLNYVSWQRPKQGHLVQAL